jgi:hypothetical protein
MADKIVSPYDIITKDYCVACHEKLIDKMSSELQKIYVAMDKMREDLPRRIEESINKSIKLAILEFNNERDKQLEAKLKDYAPKEDFTFWRNVLISGIIVSMFVAIMGMLLKNSI